MNCDLLEELIREQMRMQQEAGKCPDKIKGGNREHFFYYTGCYDGMNRAINIMKEFQEKARKQ